MQGPNVTRGASISCGCLRVEVLVAANIARNTTHGASRSSLFKLWVGVLNRCDNVKNKDWHKYGGRGISVCDRWREFVNFRDDMGPRPSAKHSVERVDNSLGYEPGNCVWALPKEQAQNRRDSLLMEHLGITKTVAAWADFAGLPRPTVYWRYKMGQRGAHLLRPVK